MTRPTASCSPHDTPPVIAIRQQPNNKSPALINAEFKRGSSPCLLAILETNKLDSNCPKRRRHQLGVGGGGGGGGGVQNQRKSGDFPWHFDNWEMDAIY